MAPCFDDDVLEPALPLQLEKPIGQIAEPVILSIACHITSMDKDMTKRKVEVAMPAMSVSNANKTNTLR